MANHGTRIRKYMAQMPSSSEEATQKHWERLFKRVNKETGLDKPKAPSKAAVKMSEKRKAEVAMLKALGDDQLVEMLAAYKAEDNFTKANAVKKEMKDRNKSADDAVNAERKELRETIRKQLAQTMDIELLRSVSAMLPKLVMQAQWLPCLTLLYLNPTSVGFFCFFTLLILYLNRERSFVATQ
mgnify:CR=1 FL=1